MLHLKNSKEIGFKKTYGSISKTEMEDNPNVPLPKKKCRWGEHIRAPNI